MLKQRMTPTSAEVGSLDGLIKAKSMAQRPLKPDISKIARRHCAQAPVFLEPI